MTAEVQYQCKFEHKARKPSEGPSIRMANERPALTAEVKVTISGGIFAAPLTQSIEIGEVTNAVQGSVIAAAIVYRIADLLDDATAQPLTMHRVGSPVLTTGSAGGLLRFTLELDGGINVQIQVPGVSDIGNFGHPAKEAIIQAAEELRGTAKTFWKGDAGRVIHDLLDKIRGNVWGKDPHELVGAGLESMMAGD